ncbi:MAG: hypothetical protein ACAH80_03065 [Alphaproteobacteria bacterium]
MQLVPERLKKLFNRQANKPEDTGAKKKKKRSWLWKYYLGSAAMAVALQFAPQHWYSQSLNEHMAAKGITVENADQYYSANNIRVYSRSNPLYIWHEAGNMVKVNAQETFNDPAATVGAKAITVAATPFIFAGTLFNTTTTFIMPHPLDAHALVPDQPLDQRTCFIRPPGDVTADKFVNKFTGFDVKDYKFKSDKGELRKIFYTYVMGHEARHCDQNMKLHTSSLNEADADLYALRLVNALGGNSAAVQEAQTILEHVRMKNAVAGSDAYHGSTLTLQRMGQTPMDAQQDYANASTLNRLLRDADEMNKGTMIASGKGGEMEKVERFYHLTRALLDGGYLKDKPALTQTAQSFLKSMEYFQGVSDGKVIKTDHAKVKIDLTYLTRQYLPAPDKIPAKAPAVRPAA